MQKVTEINNRASANWRRWLLPVSLILGMVLLSISVYLLIESTRSTGSFQKWRNEIYLLNILSIGILFLLVLVNLIRLIRQYRRAVPGARLTFNMLVLLLPLVLIPLAFMYYFSTSFTNDAVDSWFNSNVEKGLLDAYELSDQSLANVQQEYINETFKLGIIFSDLYGRNLVEKVDGYRETFAALQVSVFDMQGRVLANSGGTVDQIFPQFPDKQMMFQVEYGTGYFGFETQSDGNLLVRTATLVPQVTAIDQKRVLVVDYPVTDEVSAFADNAKSLYTSYNELLNYRQPLKQSFSLSLGLAFLASMLAAVFAAMKISQRIVSPMQELAEGTRLVAQGDFTRKLDVKRNDEVGFLTSAFNQMTERLEKANNVAEQSQMLVESERANLASILARLSTGVLSFDSDLRLRRANQAADQILDADLDLYLNQVIQDIPSSYDDGDSSDNLLKGFIRECVQRIQAGQLDWRDEFGFRLLRAQRDAAWGEVARRLAHEIKNPLTPIQLSAERLQYRCADKLPKAERDILESATQTIIAQVDAMKEMVNAFRDYAQTPELELKEFELSQLLKEILTLYRPRNKDIDLQADVSSISGSSNESGTGNDPLLIEADINRLRQVLHNLFKNSYDALSQALEKNIIQKGSISLDVEHIKEPVPNKRQDVEFIRVSMQDNAGGFDEALMETLFEPYVTTKVKGTGLGLSIVRKLVEEHLGVIELSNRSNLNGEKGAVVTILLPLNEKARLYALSHGKSMQDILARVLQKERKNRLTATGTLKILNQASMHN